MNTVVSQAIATGLPVITTAHSGLPEQIIHEKNGLVVPEGDFNALAEAILLLINRCEEWGDFGQFGREHALLHYDAGGLISRQIDAYREALERRNTAVSIE